MPHAVGDNEIQDEQDDALINKLFNDPTQNFDFLDRDLDVGEKANNAVDFEDIGDDDLAEDEDDVNGFGTNGRGDDEDRDMSGGTFSDVPGGDADDDGFDDLFGDLPSSPTDEASQQKYVLPPSTISSGISLPGPTKPSEPRALISGTEPEADHQPTFRDVNYGATVEEDEDDEYREQRELFAQAQREREERQRRGAGAADLLPPPNSAPEIFEQIWPRFEQDMPPRFSQLLPAKRAFYIAKTPIKPPKPIQPTKVNLDILQDQERSFKLPNAVLANKSARQVDADQNGVIVITDGARDENSSSDEMELDAFDNDDEEMVGGITWQDLNVICEDWEVPSPDTISVDEEAEPALVDSFEDDDWTLDHTPPTKKRKAGNKAAPLPIPIYNNSFPSFDDPELTTARLARKIILDLNDPQLLIDIQQPNAEQNKPRKVGADFRRDVKGSLSKSIFQRYNISNDEAYDALKENHQHKVRSTLGHMAVEHGMPALKLQYPFYQVKLSDREARSFHRPTFHCKTGERVSILPNKTVKRKRVKNLKPQEAFVKAEDLTLADNSNMLLFEYSEEYPTIMSNFAMGNKLVNYYRRKDNEDNSRPKFDLGETAVLLPQDKSPFSIFGDVEPGQTVPALHNAMFRTPVFKHDPKSTDFLMVKSTTGIDGSKWHLRNIENLMIVGQEFPSVEVPGVHSRKVTEAGKKRLKMLSFRMYRKNLEAKVRGPILSNEMIRNHLPGTDVAQNRSRMREIMQYDKDTSSWKPKDGEIIPDEDTMRSWIKPEDICLIDSMQVGNRHLQDAGYNKADVDEDDEENDGQTLDEKLAPWQTTKNFLNACQGKAMLELHGEGDPTGRGEAFSFIKTSMKGGFKDLGESIGDKLDAKRVKELGGHSYNVARQQRLYEEAIKRIWAAQSQSLSSTMEHSDTEMDVDHVDAEQVAGRGKTPRSEFGTPAFHRDDETTSQFSRFSNTSQKGKVLKISRKVRNKYGNLEEEPIIVRDPKVIREYVRRRRAAELSQMTLADLKPTGDAEYDARQRKRLEEELARLQRNAERREVREKAKGLHTVSGMTPATPGSPTAGPSKAAGTQRKCANCGQVGHIKTNKKLCPMLNGTMAKQNDVFDDATFSSPVTVTATPSASQMGPPAGSPM